MHIEKVTSSRISAVDFDQLKFGQEFSDHMLVCHFDGKNWLEPKIQPYGPFEVQPALHIFHYGQAIFEGMKAFKTDAGEVVLFRPEMNFKRFNASADRMCMPQVPEHIFMDGLKALVDLDRDWVPSETGRSLYLRPFMFASSNFIKADASEAFTFMIICSPTASYFSGEVRLKVEKKYTRAAQGGTGFAKAAGNYAASFYPVRSARAEGFTQILWTDGKDHEYVEECGTMNMMFIKEGVLITPPLSDSILPGITRDSILTLAKAMGLKVEERKVSLTEVREAYVAGTLTEAFGVGTAAVVSPVNQITLDELNMKFEHGPNSWALRLKTHLQDIQQGRVDDAYGWIQSV